MDSTALIAIDWGTTSARAYRLARDGALLETREAPLGISHVAGGDFAAALSRLLGDWMSIGAPRIASGMIGSRQGWIEAAYLPCPARFAELAGSLARTPGNELSIVPGITTRDEHRIPDVMRGEETQLAGVVGGDGSAIAVLPGTHSKWARVSTGAITDFRTSMTGEVYGALIEHTILGRLVVPTGALDEASFDRGVARGLADGELLHDAFGARTLALAGELAGAAVADWLSGLLIGREIRSARAWLGPALDHATVWIVGTDALVVRYRRALAAAGIGCRTASSDAAVRGLFRIAKASGILR